MFNKSGTVENVISSLARREYFISIGRKTMESENLTVFMVYETVWYWGSFCFLPNHVEKTFWLAK
jgi:hypothetical protein